jgi:hypothetical protein
MTETQHAVEESTPSVDDASLTEGGELEAEQSAPTDAAYDRRRQRIFDHRIEAQNEPSTITACLAGVNSDLLDTELIIAETLRQGLSENGRSLDAIERHAELINMLLRFSKQISQVTQLEQRSRKNVPETTKPTIG